MDSPFADGIGCAKLEEVTTSNHHKGGVIMNGTTMGIDIAKNVFEVYVEDGSGAVVERKRLPTLSRIVDINFNDSLTVITHKKAWVLLAIRNVLNDDLLRRQCRSIPH